MDNSQTSRPDSPCRAVCTTLYTQICNGCGRTYQEVADWSTYTQEQKDNVWKRLEQQQNAKK